MQPSAFKQQQYNQFEVRKTQYNVHWKTDLIGAICAAPCSCLAALVCSPCFSYYVRKRVLYNDLSRYVCCNGDCPCSGRMSEQSCPEVCLAMEVCFCFAQSVASSRWAIQDEQHIRNTACDNCIIGTMIAAQYVACICNIAACFVPELGTIADVADSIAHVLWTTVCACMQTQAKVQLDERDKDPGIVRPPFNPLQAPQQQAIPVGQQPGGYPPQGPPPGNYGQQGYPPQGYPQGPPPQQYPPQGYPQGYPGGAPQGYPGDQKMSR